ncbi:hypothetical protein H9P43_006334 [Blastocladiella emersonii ATCC 22665]|nr:hypothetical protein H9P43_006334 [Blastocladiella emersonii ATCC 22665]
MIQEMVSELSIILPIVAATALVTILASAYAVVQLLAMPWVYVLLPVACVFNVAPSFYMPSYTGYAFMLLCYGYTLWVSMKSLKDRVDEVESEEAEGM